MLKKFFVLCVIMVLTACSSSDEYQPEELPTTATFSLVSDEGVNPNIAGDPAPIEVQVFELEDDSMFMSAGFDQLRTDYEDALSSNFINNYDYVLTPGQFKFVNAFEIDEDTNYIGVMAHFAEPNLGEWKKAVKVLSKGREYHLLMLFQDYDVKLEKVE